MSRFAAGIPVLRLLLNLGLALAALLLTHVFLVRIPNYLVARSPRDAETARIIAPGWSPHVEAAPRATGSGAGPIPDGVPAAPDRD
ncbi:hypothetical protein K8I85_15475 [bacterium]|nr:hypothetical protein [bacterium]